MKDNLAIKNAFNQAAQTYDQYTPMQQWSGQYLLKLLLSKNPLMSMDKILDLGCGTGLNTRKLHDQFKPELLDAVDISEKMLTQAKIVCHDKNIRFIQSDFDLDLPMQRTHYNLIYANMSLQWSDDLNTSLKQYFDKLSPKGLMALSIPLTGTFSELSEHCQINTFSTEHDVLSTLKRTGFNASSHIKTYRIIYSSERARLKAIKQAGANHIKNRSDQHSISELRKRLQNDSEESYPLTYHVGFFVGEKQ